MKRRKRFERANNNRGTVTVVAALLMLVFVGFMAFAIDVGYAMINRNDLQNVADGAALAATRQLGSIYKGMSYEAQQAYVGNRAAIVPVAQEVASKNYVKDDSGNTIIIDPADVSVGVWNFATRKFYPGVNPPNAVNVTVRRDGSGQRSGSNVSGRGLGDQIGERFSYGNRGAEQPAQSPSRRDPLPGRHIESVVLGP